MPPRPVRNYAAPLSWDPGTSRYRDRLGRFVSYGDVEAVMGRALDRAENAMRRASLQLRAGEITLAQWQRRMTENIRAVHVTSSAMALGGIPRMDASDIERTRATIRRELGYLQQFAEGIQDGSVKLDGTFLSRAGQYTQAGRESFGDSRTVAMGRAGYDEMANLRSAGDNCAGCKTETDKGWVPLAVGALLPIGTRDCRRNCRCSFIYRKSETGETSY